MTLEKKRILIVDDDENIRNAIRRMLAIDNIYLIEEAQNGGEAEEQIECFIPDLVILDIKMPGKDGYDVSLDIRRHDTNKKIKIIAISGLMQNVIEPMMEALGVDYFFEKPFDNQLLKEKIQELLNSE